MSSAYSDYVLIVLLKSLRMMGKDEADNGRLESPNL